jgi:hypothetical protein
MNKLKKNINRMSELILALAIVLFAVATLARSPTVHAAPFACEPAFYQAMTGTFKKLDPETGQYADIGSTALYLNAIGYNTEDNYIYGLNNDPGGSTLMRIEHDGSYTDLGLPTGLPSAGSVVGDFDHTGNLYVLINSPNSSLYRIDITADTATEIIMSDTLSVNDFAYINGFLYGTSGTSLYRIDATTGTVTTTALGIPSAVYGAAWSTVDDRLYFSQNSSGVIYEVTGYDTVSPDATAVLQGDGNLVGNDGASCSLAPTVILDLVANNDSASTSYNTPIDIPLNTGVLVNDVGSDLTVTDFTQPANGTVTVNSDGSYTYTPNPGFTGVDTFQYTVTDSVGSTATATVSITVAPEIPSAGGLKMKLLSTVLTLTGITVVIMLFTVFIKFKHKKMKIN